MREEAYGRAEGMVQHIFNLSTQEEEERGKRIMSSRPVSVSVLKQ